MLKYFLLFLTLFSISLCEDPCSLWKNDTLMDGCCRGISEFDDDEELETITQGKCLVDDSVDYCVALRCIMEERSLLIGGKINPAAIIASVVKGKSEDMWTKPLEIAIDTCMEKMTGKNCPEDYFLDCLEIVSFVNCPNSEWTNSDTCTNLKRILSACVF